MHIVVVMDPASTVLVDEDTSFALMIAAEQRGHRVDHCLVEDVFFESGRAFARVRRATMKRDPAAPITLGAAEDVSLADVDAVLVRKDPPFDFEYLWLTLMLERLRDTTVVVNDPRGLREANEKLYACHFPELMPETLVTAHGDRIREFLTRVGGRAVIKPVDGHGGGGVFALSDGDPNKSSLIETVTRRGSRVAMIQRYLPEVVDGDKRILLLDGEPLGAITRLPQGGDLRSNIHVGGKVVATDIDADDRRIIATIAPRLRHDGLWFVGIDVIGGKLTEINVTSPTGIQQMSRLTGEALEARAIAWLEERVDRLARR